MSAEDAYDRLMAKVDQYRRDKEERIAAKEKKRRLVIEYREEKARKRDERKAAEKEKKRLLLLKYRAETSQKKDLPNVVTVAASALTAKKTKCDCGDPCVGSERYCADCLAELRAEKLSVEFAKLQPTERQIKSAQCRVVRKAENLS